MDRVTDRAADTQTVGRTHPMLVGIMRLYLTVAVPVLLTLLSARLVMTPLFLEIQYHRPDFPEDPYGFTREDRLEYGHYAIEYLLNDAGISYLGDLTFPDGSPLYNERELKHMEDVKVVTRLAFLLLAVGGLAAVTAFFVLWRDKSTRGDLRLGLFNGSILTLGIIGAIVLLALTAWDVFFTGFHVLLFENGTWRFLYSDTLIRLFPERFWFDAALVVGTFTVLGALFILIVTWRWGKIDPTSV